MESDIFLQTVKGAVVKRTSDQIGPPKVVVFAKSGETADMIWSLLDHVVHHSSLRHKASPQTSCQHVIF